VEDERFGEAAGRGVERGDEVVEVEGDEVLEGAARVLV